MLKLYSYFRSSASYRVRIALHWKRIKFEYVPIHLIKEGGLQNQADFRRINPMGHVPALDHDGFLVAESMAILQYIEDLYPGPKLIPNSPRDKAEVLRLCETINSGIQPLQNLKVQKLLEQTYHLSKADSDGFVRHWIQDGLSNLEKMLENTAGSFCLGGEVTAADCFLIPQALTARRFGVDVDSFANISRINRNALALEAFQKAQPDKQPDYQA